MTLAEYWGTTPGEVELVIHAAADRTTDTIEAGTYAVLFGRAASYLKVGERENFLASLGRSKRRHRCRRINDDLTFAETQKWKARFKERDRVATGKP